MVALDWSHIQKTCLNVRHKLHNFFEGANSNLETTFFKRIIYRTVRLGSTQHPPPHPPTPKRIRNHPKTKPSNKFLS